MGGDEDEHALGTHKGQTAVCAPRASPFLLTHSLRSPKSVAPQSQDSVSASAVSSPSSLLSLKIKGHCGVFPPTLPSCPNGGIPKLVRTLQGLGGYLPASLGEVRPG